MTDPGKILNLVLWCFFCHFAQGQVCPQSPTLSLIPVRTQKSVFVMCVIEDFYPMNLTVQWKVNERNSRRQSNLQCELNPEGLYTAHSLYKLSNEALIGNTYTCEVKHQGEKITVTKIFNGKLTLKPPIVSELFNNNRVVLEAIVSGNERIAVQEASVFCKVNNEPVYSGRGTVNVSREVSQFKKMYRISVDANKWFNGETVTCTIYDAFNDRDIKQEISIDKGDGQTPRVVIYKPDHFSTDRVSLVCEVSSPNLGDVYIMWQLGEQPYIEGSTNTRVHQKDFTSVLSILTIPKRQYEDHRNTFTCAVKHANMKDTASPLLISTSKSKTESKACECDYYR